MVYVPHTKRFIFECFILNSLNETLDFRGDLSRLRKNMAKGTTDPRVEFISQVQIQILIKFHLKNLDQASTTKSQPNVSLSINLKLQNLDQT